MNRNLLAITIVICTLFCCTFTTIQTKAQKYKNPVSYMNAINKGYKPVSNDTWDYMRTVAHSKSARKIERRRKDLLDSHYKARKSIGTIPGYKGDRSLRDSCISYLKLSTLILRNDYDKILDMEKISEESYDMMEAYLTAQEMANDKLDSAFTRMTDAYNQFAETHNVELIDKQSNRSRKMDIANRAFKYYNQIFLIQFKSSKQEAYLLEAMDNADVLAMEQNKGALIKTAEEGMAILDTLQRFSGDGSLINGCRKMLDFYTFEGEKKMPIIIDYYMKKEKFEKINKAFEAKRKNERTQEDVDQFNQAVKDYNLAVNTYNAANNELNQKRENKYNNWGIIVTNFFKRYVPRK
ncbi:MAG: hypothetical protein JEZ03_09110 [Bacteroidales bacterium]|nr:hypothetical protein [Bacteroidales bacterium]